MDDNQNQVVEETDIIEAEVVEPTDGGQAEVLLSLESMIKTNISAIDRLQTELKKQKEMLEDVFVSDETYQEHAKAAKEAAKVKGQTRAEIMKRPAVMQISNKVKSMQTDLKERQMSLSDYLKEYQRMTGVNEIEGEDGEMREIVSTVKLVKKLSRSR